MGSFQKRISLLHVHVHWQGYLLKASLINAVPIPHPDRSTQVRYYISHGGHSQFPAVLEACVWVIAGYSVSITKGQLTRKHSSVATAKHAHRQMTWHTAGMLHEAVLLLSMGILAVSSLTSACTDY